MSPLHSRRDRPELRPPLTHKHKGDGMVTTKVEPDGVRCEWYSSAHAYARLIVGPVRVGVRREWLPVLLAELMGEDCPTRPDDADDGDATSVLLFADGGAMLCVYGVEVQLTAEQVAQLIPNRVDS